MAATTYTVLITIQHDDGAAISPELLETMIQRGLEEGVRDFAGVSAASVDAMPGEVIDQFRGSASLRLRTAAAVRLHFSLRKP